MYPNVFKESSVFTAKDEHYEKFKEKIDFYRYIFPVTINIGELFGDEKITYENLKQKEIFQANGTKNSRENIVNMSALLTFVEFFRKSFTNQEKTPFRSKKGYVTIFLPSDRWFLKEVLDLLNENENCGNIMHELIFNGGIFYTPFSSAEDVAESIIKHHNKDFSLSNYKKDRTVLFYGNEQDPVVSIAQQFLQQVKNNPGVFQLTKTHNEEVLRIYDSINIYLSLVDFIENNADTDTVYYDYLESIESYTHVDTASTESMNAAYALFSRGKMYTETKPSYVNSLTYFLGSREKKIRNSFLSLLCGLNVQDLLYLSDFSDKMINHYNRQKEVNHIEMLYVLIIFEKIKTRKLHNMLSPYETVEILKKKVGEFSNGFREFTPYEFSSKEEEMSQYIIYNCIKRNARNYLALVPSVETDILGFSNVVNLFDLGFDKVDSMKNKDLAFILLISSYPAIFFNNNGHRTLVKRMLSVYEVFPDFDDFITFLRNLSLTHEKIDTKESSWNKLMQELSKNKNYDIMGLDIFADILGVEKGYGDNADPSSSLRRTYNVILRK